MQYQFISPVQGDSLMVKIRDEMFNSCQHMVNISSMHTVCDLLSDIIISEVCTYVYWQYSVRLILKESKKNLFASIQILEHII